MVPKKTNNNVAYVNFGKTYLAVVVELIKAVILSLIEIIPLNVNLTMV